MAGAPQKVLNWLYSVLTSEYQDVNRTYNDIAQALAQYPTLSPRTEVYTYDNGASALLVRVSGTIPADFRGRIYRFPITMWIPHAYPHESPIVYVTPSTDMIVRPGQHVGDDGRVYHPYLARWADFSDKSTILDLLIILAGVFSKEPPVVARQQSLLQGRQVRRQQTSTPPPVPPPPPEISGVAVNSLYQPKVAGRQQGDSSRTHQAPPLPNRPSALGYHAGAVRETSAPPPLPPHPSPSSVPSSQYGSSQPSQSPLSANSLAQQPFLDVRQRISGLRELCSSDGPTNPQQDLGPVSPALGDFSKSHPHVKTQQPPRYSGPGFLGPPGVNAVFQPQQPPQPQQQQLPPPQRQSSAYAGQDSSSKDRFVQNSMSYPANYVQQPQYYQPQQQPLNPASSLPKARLPLPDLLSNDNPPPSSHLSSASASAPAPVRPPNPERSELLFQIGQRLQARRGEVLQQSTSTRLPPLLTQQASLHTAQRHLTSELKSLRALKSTLDADETILRSALRQADEVIQDVNGKDGAEKKQPPDVDELLVATSVVGRQLYEIVCEERSVGEARWILGRGVEGGVVRLDTFLKQSRSLAREQFLREALIKKIVHGMGLSEDSF